MPTQAWEDKLPIKTYTLGPDDPNPPWDKRGESLIYPYSMQDNLSGEVRTVDYRALHLENDYAHAIVLPELGGHLYSLYDKVGGREVFYRNNVVKYGLVARRGAWISGGVEFNFPKGHTCVTVAPVLSDIVEGDHPAIRVGSLDRTTRMRWTVKLWLQGCALRHTVVLENPTPLRQRHYFWANSAVPAADDLHLVYPAAKARTGGGVHAYPLKDGLDMSWYRSHDHADDIFTLDVRDDFFGCYYEQQDCGMVHWSEHHKNLGKKFFTWGTADDGMRWVDLLTDDDGQYVEIQSGRFVDQSTFEFLSPFRQVSWDEQWWGLHGMGGFVWANHRAALNLKREGDSLQLAVLPATLSGPARLVLTAAQGAVLHDQALELSPGQPVRALASARGLAADTPLRLALTDGEGTDLVVYHSPAQHELRRARPLALAPAPATETTPDAEELCLQAVRHEKQAAFERAREAYRQALELAPACLAAHFGLGVLDCRAGLFEDAREHLLQVVERDAEHDEAGYYLGLAYLELGRREEAELVLWRLMGRTACRDEAAVLLARLAQSDPALRGGRGEALADELLSDVRLSDTVETMRGVAPPELQLISGFDVLVEADSDHGWPALLDRQLGGDPEEWLEVALAYAALGNPGVAALLLAQAQKVSERAAASPLLYYHLAALDPAEALHWRASARACDPAYCFPSRLDDVRVLAAAAEADPTDWLARLLLGNVLAFLGREEEALSHWLTAAQSNDANPVLCRNLGLAHSLWRGEHDLARAWYRKALAVDPAEYHLYLEQDRALRRAEAGAEERLAALRQAPPEAHDRWEIAALEADCLVILGRWEEALELMGRYTFLPWEGARGMHTLWVLALGGLAEQQRAAGDLPAALASCELALTYPHNLCVGRTAYPEEARLHWLAAELARELGQEERREQHLRAAAEERHRHLCEADLYSRRALEALGRQEEAEALASRLRQWSHERLQRNAEDRLALEIREELGVEV